MVMEIATWQIMVITTATGKFKELKNKVCDYAVLITDKFTVIQDHSCK